MRDSGIFHDSTGRATRCRFVYLDNGTVTIELVGIHDDTQVATACTVPRVLFADVIRKLGVM